VRAPCCCFTFLTNIRITILYYLRCYAAQHFDYPTLRKAVVAPALEIRTIMPSLMKNSQFLESYYITKSSCCACVGNSNDRAKFNEKQSIFGKLFTGLTWTDTQMWRIVLSPEIRNLNPTHEYYVALSASFFM
jgi:hypothetical protein